MRKIVRTEGADGTDRRTLLDTSIDEDIYSSSSSESRGIELYIHRTRDVEDGPIWYVYHWSRWQNERCYIEMVDEHDSETGEDGALDIIEDHLDDVSDKALAYIIECGGPDIMADLS